MILTKCWKRCMTVTTRKMQSKSSFNRCALFLPCVFLCLYGCTHRYTGFSVPNALGNHLGITVWNVLKKSIYCSAVVFRNYFKRQREENRWHHCVTVKISHSLEALNIVCRSCQPCHSCNRTRQVQMKGNEVEQGRSSEEGETERRGTF